MFKIQFLTFFMLLICVAKYSEEAVVIRGPVQKPAEFADQEGCYIPEIKKVVAYEATEAPINDSCLQYTCHDDNTTSIFSCGAVGYDKKTFTFSQDFSQAYPCCCATLTSKIDGTSMNVGGSDCK